VHNDQRYIGRKQWVGGSGSFLKRKRQEYKRKIKGIVRGNLRWVISGINPQLLLFCLDAYIFFYLKRHYPIKQRNPVLAFNDHKK
jgi:hypothetical protein